MPDALTPIVSGSTHLLGHEGAFGRRRYVLHVPPSQPTGLVVLLHGGNQTASEFALATGMGAVADERGWLVAYPQQSRSASPQRYWNWFSPAHQAAGRGEPALLAELTSVLVTEWSVPTRSVFLGGFSAGGAMAAVLAATYPRRFAAAAIHSGLPYRSASDLFGALAAMAQGAPSDARTPPGPPMLVIQGDADRTVAPANARALLTPITAATVPTSLDVPAVGSSHAYRRTDYRAPDGSLAAASVLVHHGGHDWFGGVVGAGYADPRGPSSARLMAEFFAAVADPATDR